jgi:hypothetical protein
MTRPASVRTPTNRSLIPIAVVLLVVVAAIVGIFAHQPASSTAIVGGVPARVAQRAIASETDGVLPDGVTVFDDEYPGVANLDPDLLHVLRVAATDAAADGIEFTVNSGWRSPLYQNQLLREAVVQYGSEQEAARWVATADTSPHVSGNAVDVGPSDSDVWLHEHGASYGLCQIYANELWHYELRVEAIDRGCPPMYADPTDDPRMHP